MAACSYLFFVPALYLILSDKRKTQYAALHAAQALVLWCAITVVFIGMRVVYLTLVFTLGYFWVIDIFMKLIHLAMWGYAAYCGYLAFKEKEVLIPYVSNLAYKLT